MIYFTADTHFGHEAIMRHSKRPFLTVSKHDAVLVSNINAVVQPSDTLYHLGDFAWHNLASYRARIRCKQIHLVLGNHDRLKAPDRELFCSISDIKKVRVAEQKIYLCHYAMRVWNCSHHGSWHLYGHSHGSLADDPHARSLDVGVDCHSFFPVSIDRVAELMSQKQWQAVDHHAPAS